MVRVDERTPLRKGEGLDPPYMFMTSPHRQYRKQIHQFQCLLCILFLMLFLALVTMSLLHMIRDDTIDNDFNMYNSSVEPLLSMSWPINDKDVNKWDDEPSQDVIQTSLSAAQLSLAEKDKLESRLIGLPLNSPSYKHQKSVKTSQRATYLARTGFVLDVATKDVLKKMGSTKKTVGRSTALKSSMLPNDICGNEIKGTCSNSQYRTTDGSCNNLNNPHKWGVALQPFRRVLPPDYADGVSEPRKSSDGSNLPSAREVSVTVHRPEYRGDDQFTVMLAVWGQFLDHDISATALSQGKDGNTISCCEQSETDLHPECFPVSVQPDDPYFKNITCLEFVRSAPAPTCSLGSREQLNQASSYIDGSVVYGNTDELMASLRSFDSGMLRMTVTSDGRTLLPISTDPTDGCNNEEENSKGRYCFASGDPRANENIHLTTMHLIMARQHNSIAAQLSSINPNWDDEKLFQESRKIVAAQMQHITYNEFLPVLLGPKIMDAMDLQSNEDEVYEKYDSRIDPTVSNNFATASFRFAHTLLPGMMKIMKNMTSEEQIQLHKLLFDPYKLYAPGYLDSTLTGAMNTPLERVDNYFSKEVKENLFKQPSKPCGLDLVSLNIQRGRDHGLPSYPNWREHCGLSRPSNFNELQGVIDQESLDRMTKLYKSVDDVDLYTGALSEYPIKGGMLGPTLTCLIGDQFKRLKVGDRYWYETSEQPIAFTNDQLKEIRKTSLANIICNTADSVDQIRPKVMLSGSPDNQQISCNELLQPDITAWSDLYSTNKQANTDSKTVSSGTSSRIGLHVNEASFTTDEGFTWSGETPVNIPISVFGGLSSHLTPSLVQWSITSVTVSADELSISGRYSVKKDVFSEPDSTKTTIKESTGGFTIKSSLLWNNTDISSVLLTETKFSSLLFFSGRTPKKVIDNQTKQPLKFVLVNPPEILKMSSGMISKAVTESSLILSGNYTTTDKTVYKWSGDLMITLPLKNDLQKPSDVKLQSSITNSVKTRVEFKVSGGNVEEHLTDGSVKTLWNGELPLSIPLFNSGYSIRNRFFAIWSLTEANPSVKGTFSLINFIHGFGFNVSWTNGKFNLFTEPSALNGYIKPGLKYYSKIYLSEMKLASFPDDDAHDVQNNLQTSEADNQLDDFISDSLDEIGGSTPITIVLKGSYSPYKMYFKWFGEGVIYVKNTVDLEEYKKPQLMSVTPELADPSWNKNAFGGTVTNGYISINSGGIFSMKSTVWSGSLPLAIPVSYSTGNSSSYLFSLGINWSGNYWLGNTIQGKFSVPQFVGDWIPYPKLKYVDGEFSFDIKPLWNTSFEKLFLPGANYYSKISFHGGKKPKPPKNKLPSTSTPLEPSNSDLAAPIILQGTYSPDKKLFYWSGDFIIAFHNGFKVSSGIYFTDENTGDENIIGKLNLQSSKDENPLNPKPTKKPKPTKAPKPPKPRKASVSFTVTTGSVFAGFEGSNSTEIWNGNVPLEMVLDSVIDESSYTPSAQVTWSGTPTQTSLEGTFTFPIDIQNGTVVMKKNYIGNFSIDFQAKWSGNMETLVDPSLTYNCRLLFNEFNKKSTLLGASNNQELVQATDYNIPNQCNILLVGTFYKRPFYCPVLPFLCKEGKIFTWSGESIMSFTFPPLPTTTAIPEMPILSNLKAVPNSYPYHIPRKIIGKALSGSLSAGLNGRSNRLWSGEIPAVIPLPVFWAPTTEMPSFGERKVYAHGVIWSGAVFGSTIAGSFSLPQYTWNGMVSSIRWWHGSFNLHVMSLWDLGLGNLITPGMKYYSKVVFRDFRNSSHLLDSKLTQDDMKLLESTINEDNTNIQRDPGFTQEEVNAAYKAPLILLGSYSYDRKTFYWSGNFIMVFHNVPDTSMYRIF